MEKRTNQSLKKETYIISGILALVAIALIVVGMTHPEFPFPGENWAVYGIAIVSLVYAVFLVVTNRIGKYDLWTLLVVLFTFGGCVFVILSLASQMATGGTGWYLPGALITMFIAYFMNLFLRKRG